MHKISNIKSEFFCLKFNFLTFLLLFLLCCPVIFIQKVYAGFEGPRPELVYTTAWQIINNKFYFKSRINLDYWENKFNGRINNTSDAHKYITKLVKELKDPYTQFLTEEEFKEEQNVLNSTLIGIGVKLASHKPIVLDYLQNSPAEKNGIEKDDLIISVNGKSTKGLSSTEVASLLRGPKDSPLTLKIKRGNKILTKALSRTEFEIKSVSTKLLDNNIAYIKIDSFFPQNTVNLFKDELSKLMSVTGIILDLRNNSGGLVKNAVEIADMFLAEGKIVSTVTTTGIQNEYANSSQLITSKVVVLVNENTASASELLASALQENNKAIVIGKRTFGKGLIQEIIQLPDQSGLHVTTAAYLTPQGTNIHKKGIIPDEIIYDDNKQLLRAEEILMADIQAHNIIVKNNTTKHSG